MNVRKVPMPMYARLTVILALACASAATPAYACSYTHAPEPVGDASAIFIGRKMMEAATFVDFAIAEDGAQARGPDGKPVPATAITYRVLRRLKGSSSDRFILFGGGYSAAEKEAAKPSELLHWVDEDGRVTPFANVRESQISGELMMTSCDPPRIEARAGRTYLIFREVDGRALGRVAYHPGIRPAEGYPVADIGLGPTRHGRGRWCNRAIR